MIAENAPVFAPSGDWLAAPFSIDFNADLTHLLMCEGTWQGDRKAGVSLYIENYFNANALTVVLDSQTIRVPPYSNGYISLKDNSLIKVIAERGIVVRMAITTQPQVTGFNDRGNAPSPKPYIGSIVTAAIAAQYPVAQLYNPGSSNVRAIVKRLRLAGDATGSFSVLMQAVAFVGSVIQCASKISGQSDSICPINYGNFNVAPVGKQIGYYKGLAGSAPFEILYAPGDPVIILPGYGLTVYHGTVNTSAVIEFEFSEENLT